MSPKWTLFCAVAALAVACARSTPPPSAPPATPEDQVALGQKLYTQYCAKCHGAAGDGVEKKGPPVVGPSALPAEPRPGQKRKVTFRTALDVAQFGVRGVGEPVSPKPVERHRPVGSHQLHGARDRPVCAHGVALVSDEPDPHGRGL